MFTVARFALFAAAVAAAAVPAAASDRRVKIVNNTRYTIVHFYGSNTGADSWEEDILGRDVLRPGQAVRVNFDDGSGYCMFDFKAEFDDGDVVVKKKVNVCSVGTFTFN